jgi:hypothetical protein
MLIELLLSTAHAWDGGEWRVGIPAEVNLVGLAGGLRPELLWTVGAGQSLRFAAGMMVGPELTFVPVDIGYRAVFFPERKVHPELGLNWEGQNILSSGMPKVRRGAMSLDLGCRGDIGEHWSVGGHISPDFALVGDMGFGLAIRAGVWYRL